MIGRKLAVFFMIWLSTAAASMAQVIIQAQLLQRDIRLFFISDLNLTGRGRTSTELFSLTLTNTSAGRQRCCLHLTIDKNSGAAPEPLASGTTDPFTLEAGQVIRITNVNLFSQARQFSLNDYSIESGGESVRDKVLATGKLPSGIYRFTFQLQRCDGSPGMFSETYIEIDVSNPVNLDLIGPGAPADRAQPGLSPTPFPMFRWNSNLDRFRLTLAERLPDVHASASPAEIIEDRIRFQRTLIVDPARSGSLAADGAEYIATTSYAYPPAGAWPLELGKVYYWQVTGLAASSGEEISMPGEIWAFKVLGSDGSAPAGEVRIDELLATVRPAAGEAISALIARGGELDGFTATGRCWLNGRWITAEELQIILRKLSTGEYKVIETRVE